MKLPQNLAPLAPKGQVVDPRPRYVVMTPAYRGEVSALHVGMNLRLCDRSLRGGPFRYVGFAYVDSSSLEWARNRLLSDAMKAPIDWAIFADADTVWDDAAGIEAMLLAGAQRGAAIIAAPVKQRGRGGYNARRVVDTQIFELPEVDFRGRVVEADAVGTAFMAINLAWMREHWADQPWFMFHHLAGDQPQKLGEDVTFCLHVRELGGAVYVDGRLEPRHVGATYPVGHPFSESPDRTVPPPWNPPA